MVPVYLVYPVGQDADLYQVAYVDAVTIDEWSPEPIYRQLASILRARITSGEIAPGQPLPSETALQQEHGLARDTVRAAVRLLRDEGLVVTLPGRGTFVPPKRDDDQ